MWYTACSLASHWIPPTVCPVAAVLAGASAGPVSSAIPSGPSGPDVVPLVPLALLVPLGLLVPLVLLVPLPAASAIPVATAATTMVAPTPASTRIRMVRARCSRRICSTFRRALPFSGCDLAMPLPCPFSRRAQQTRLPYAESSAFVTRHTQRLPAQRLDPVNGDRAQVGGSADLLAISSGLAHDVVISADGGSDDRR